MKQADVFLESEGNAWLERNRDKLGHGRDLVSALIEANGIKPTRVLEVGCSTGWRLVKLREKYGCEVWGADPSMQALIEAADSRIPAVQCGAANLRGMLPGSFDLVIYGFCLYMTDPEDWFRIVAEGDAVLESGGYLVIHDFDPPMGLYARRYKHRDGLFAYHFDWAQLWLKHPLYHMVSRNIGDEDDVGMVTILKKSPQSAIRVQP